MALTPKELETQIVASEKSLILKVAQIIKKYTDNTVQVTADNLKKEVVDNLSKVEGLGAKLEKIQAMADAFEKVFDKNDDGTITADEIVAKLSAIQANIEKVEANVEAQAKKEADDIANVLKTAAELKGRIDANVNSIEKVGDSVKEVTANLNTNYYTKDEITQIVTIASTEIEKEVEKLFSDVQATSDTKSGSASK